MFGFLPSIEPNLEIESIKRDIYIYIYVRRQTSIGGIKSGYLLIGRLSRSGSAKYGIALVNRIVNIIVMMHRGFFVLTKGD